MTGKATTTRIFLAVFILLLVAGATYWWTRPNVDVLRRSESRTSQGQPDNP